jgi:hypothetical protein
VTKDRTQSETFVRQWMWYVKGLVVPLHHTGKCGGGGGQYGSTSSYTRRLSVVSGKPHVPAALSPERKSGSHRIGAGLAPEVTCTFRRTEKALAPAEIRVACLLVRSLVTIRTLVSKLHW